MEKEIQIIENLKVIAEHLNKHWDGRFSQCGCGAHLIGHPENCRGCGSSDLTYLEVSLKPQNDSKRGQFFEPDDPRASIPTPYKGKYRV